MRRYAIWGTATSPAHEEWVRAVGEQFEADDFVRVDDIADADFVLNMFDAARSEGVPARVAGHLLRGVLRARRGSGRRPEGELPDARADALERRAPPRPGQGRLVHDDGAGHVPRRRGSRPRSTSASSRSRPRASSSTTSGSPISSRSSGTATRSPRTSPSPAGGSTSSTSCPRRSRSRTTSRAATSAT